MCIRDSITATLQATIEFQGQQITSINCSTINGRAHFAVNISNDDPNFRLHYWSPSEPLLYDITFKVIYNGSVTDSVYSYFGMRQIETRNGSVYLNDQLLYQKLVLNQGYYPDSVSYTHLDVYKRQLTSQVADLISLGTQSRYSIR